MLFDCILSRHITNQGTIKILKVLCISMISFFYEKQNPVKSDIFECTIEFLITDFKFILTPPRCCVKTADNYFIIKTSISFRRL